MEQEKYSVCVRCMTYNQSALITETLDSFCMQKTRFPFVCVILDDASTDGEQEVIKQYLHNHFDLDDKEKVKNEETNDYYLTFARHKTNTNCFFAVYYLKYNHYFTKDKTPYYSEWLNTTKYFAMCEGDDYWVDPLKLQKQYDYMEAHPDCSLCFHANYRLFPNGEKVPHTPRVIKETYSAKDVILGAGGMMATNSMFFHSSDYLPYEHRPLFWKSSFVGDVPIRLYLVSKGYIGYINELMSVYRKSAGAWFMRNQKISVRIDTTKKAQRVLGLFDEYTSFRFHKYIVLGKLLNWMRCSKLILMILKNRILSITK